MPTTTLYKLLFSWVPTLINACYVFSKLLACKGSSQLLTKLDNHGESVLHEACSASKDTYVKMLLEKDADLRLLTLTGSSMYPVHVAAEFSEVKWANMNIHGCSLIDWLVLVSSIVSIYFVTSFHLIRTSSTQKKRLHGTWVHIVLLIFPCSQIGS